MKKVILSTIAIAALSASSALAADLPVKAVPIAAPPPPAWNIAFGGAIMSDYNFRGVSQSNKGPSGTAYIEPQFNTSFGTLYVGLAGWGIDWPSGAGYGFTAPSAEIDIYGGWRNTWGAFSLDIGTIYYYYPRESFNGFTNDSDFIEFYAKPSYAITPDLTIGGTVFYSPDVLHYSRTFATFAALGGVAGRAHGLYASLTGKWVLPWKSGDLGAYTSGELGHWWLNSSPFTGNGFLDPSYTYYNIGLAFTYKAITVDLRYHGTNMSVARCGSFLLTGVPNNSNNWCNDTFIGSVKFDTTLNDLK